MTTRVKFSDLPEPNEYHLITFDPGAAATGWTWFIVDFHAFSRPENKLLRWIKYWDCGEFTGPETSMLSDCVNLIYTVQNHHASYLNMDVVSEDFELTQLIGSKENLLSPVRINSVIGWECYKKAIRFQLQARQLRTNVTRDKLQRYGFEGKFRKDEFAAIQHAIVWLRNLKLASKSRPWKLGEGGQLNSRWDCACAEGKEHDLIHP